MLPTEAKGDFRRRAIRASLESVAESRRDEPAEAGVSCCLPTEHSRGALNTQKWATIACLILGFAGLAGGAGFAWLSDRWGGEGHNWLTLGIGGCCTLSGFVFLVLPMKGGGLFLRPYLWRRLADLKAMPGITEIFYMGLEDPQTFDEIKLSSDDAG